MVENPHKKGSHAHAIFETHIIWYAGKDVDALRALYAEKRAEAENFLRHSWKAMQQITAEANAIKAVLDEKVG